MKKTTELRNQIITIARATQKYGLNYGSEGNVSYRTEAGFLITPTGIAYDYMNPEDIVEVYLDQTIPPGQKLPSSEWHFHCDIYNAREDAQAVVHTHSTYATALACVGKDIPAFHYRVALVGGDSVRCSEYETFGTKELSKKVLLALEYRKACLIANHGLVAVGKNLDDAFNIAIIVENLAEQYCKACQMGNPILLDDQEMKKLFEKFENYGQQSS